MYVCVHRELCVWPTTAIRLRTNAIVSGASQHPSEVGKNDYPHFVDRELQYRDSLTCPKSLRKSVEEQGIQSGFPRLKSLTIGHSSCLK